LHLFNSCAEAGAGLLVVTAMRRPLGRSRCPTGVAVARRVGGRIAPPDDALLAAVLVKHFADRQLRVAPAVIAYLVRRMERSFAAAAALAARLDRLALADGRPIGLALARRALAEYGA